VIHLSFVSFFAHDVLSSLRVRGEAFPQLMRIEDCFATIGFPPLIFLQTVYADEAFFCLNRVQELSPVDECVERVHQQESEGEAKEDCVEECTFPFFSLIARKEKIGNCTPIFLTFTYPELSFTRRNDSV
jgi:hypothetical protein